MWKKRKKKWRPRTRSSGPTSAMRFPRFSSFLLLILFFASLLPRVGSLASTLALPTPASPAASSVSKKLKPNDPYALIFGTVWGPDDHPVYGVKVYIRRVPRNKPKWELYSDHAGEFAQRVPAGKADYIVSADLKGVKTQEGQTLHLAQEAAVHVEYDERIDIGLHLVR
jgi:hypothetical protein